MAEHSDAYIISRLVKQTRLLIATDETIPIETKLLTSARRRGCRVLDGGGMAVFQAADAFRLFTGREPDAARMRAAFLKDVGLVAE